MAQNGALFHTQEHRHISLAQGKGTHVKWLKKHGRGRKVEEGTPASVSVITPSLCTLPSPLLLNFPCDPSLTEV